MKACLHILASLACITGLVHAQNPSEGLVEPVAEAVAGQESAPPVTVEPPPSLPAAAGQTPPEAAPDPGAVVPVTPPPAAGAAPAPQQEMQKSEEGYIIKDAGLNDIFQFLAKAAGRQYFHNSKISGPEFLVTGHLNDGNPLQQMEELAFMYGLSLHTKGNTLYALTQAQLAQLPSAEFHYQLRYLRPTDMEQIKELIKPILTPGTGIVNFEPKTNTIVIIDSAHRIEQARELLHNVDQAKGQIIVETKILRINSGTAERVGVNWSSSLGEAGTDLTVIRDLNSVFGIDGPKVLGVGGDSNTNLVLSPLQLSGVLRALAEGGVARQVSNPTLITEDNEQATISIIDRVPIITQTVQPGGGDSGNITTEEVRYKIDESDKSIDTDPEKHREIGISLVVTPTLLPDGTVRMRMRPRTAQIVASKQVVSQSGNIYPFVTESMVEAIARVPDGHSLVIGGFYGEEEGRDRTKVPLLGDVPLINFFFKSKDNVKEQASLVFVVTPKSYNPSSTGGTRSASDRIHSATALDCEHDWIDPQNPGPAHEPNIKRGVRGLQPTQAPYYPRAGETPGRSSYSQPAATGPRFSRARK